MKTRTDKSFSALIGFLLSLTPLSCDLMGWRGAGGNGAASTGSSIIDASNCGKTLTQHCLGVYFFFGGVLMVLGSIGEWIIGNTFPFVVFGTFGMTS